ncbi:uncharacterized protein PADG_03057 [Paracoccidioides brasiliensis Pb18]|uniref:Fungal-type protein kinase domain-containing protein n=1 Tax=Paracoccidioides brasiliensis (strain Pb18) TaxID=502780 RepID=C1G7A2_PARBD|nr:uncharacterized protein PADG_03057 [Paracoccidioides brasiliensis Pb18]EEH46959.1 hypothetical protein PADG_03057 [Paracoccidioides brasiliensis Pb18]
MTTLSPHDSDIIAKHPFNDSLNSLRGPLQEAEQAYDASADPKDEICQRAISKLLSFFLGQEIAVELQSKISKHSVARELVDIHECILKGDFNYNDFRLLARLIIQKAPDVDIWKAVLDLTVTISQSIPPLTSIPPFFTGTPVKSTSSSQKDSEQTRELVNMRIFEEICDCTFQNVEGFFNKYFKGKDWSDKADAICQHVLAPDSDGNWAQFPDPPMQSDVLTWWFQLQKCLLSESRSIYSTTVSKANLTGSKTEWQLDLLLKARSTSLSQDKHDWRDILVIGELKKSEKEIRAKDTLLQISCYVFVGYTMMSDEELGLDTFIARNEDGSKSITIKESESSEELTLRLSEMLTFQHAIVCCGTTCFLTDDGEVEGVAKLSWVSDKWCPEVELLKLAAQKNVQGIARIIGHSTITSIADMRCGLTFDNKHHDFKSATSSRVSSLHQSQPSAEPCHLNIHQTSSRKCKYPGKGMQVSKQPHFASQSLRTSQQNNELTFSIQSVHTPSLFDRNGKELYDNCVLRCLVISPAGRPIYKYKSPLELLMALRDAIKAHQSLYLDGNILHQDISENNIIITNPEKTDGHSGMLIDLDLAKEVGSEQSGACYWTGTMEFMAIEVLLNVNHTYRHDLESFFYVLIWQCAHNSWRKLNELQRQRQRQPQDSLLREWYTGTYVKIATYKRGNMEAGGFELVLQEFPLEFECVKHLCRTIRGVLFPYGKEGMIVGTPQDPKILYDPIIKAYDDAIAVIEA